MALLCASHSGEPRHVAGVADMLRRAGCQPDQLQCGVHPPLFYAARDELPPAGVIFTPLQHNCSGKHTGMLAYCRHCGLPTETYLAFDHPLQRAIRQAVAHLTGVAESSLVAGIDGCSAPELRGAAVRARLRLRATRRGRRRPIRTRAARSRRRR